MKKIIIKITILSFLNLIGCYSQKVITYDEFYAFQNLKEASVITSDTNRINLTSDSLKYNYMNWNVGSDTLTIYSTHLEKVWSTALKPVSDTVWLPKEEITNVYIDEFDETKTIFAIAIPITLIILSIIAINNMTGAGIGGGNY
jgi:hypothetical protein